MTTHKFLCLILVAVIANACAPAVNDTAWRHVGMAGLATSPQTPEMPTRLVSFETTEGTNLNIDVSPDGETLTFDLLGDIYLLPFPGGEAVSLTAGRAWDQAPRFSPDGESVYFVSDRQGYKNIWRVSLEDRSVREVTTSGSNIMGTPNWSQDGAHLIAARADAYTGVETVLQSVDPATGTMSPLEDVDGPWIDMDTSERYRDRIMTFSGAQAANGEVYVAEARPNADYSDLKVEIYKIDPATRERELVTPADAPYSEFKPQLSHDGKLLAYFRQYPDRRTELRVLHRETGRERALFQLTDADDASYYAWHQLWPNYAFTPDDQHIVFWQDGKIHRVRLADGANEIIPFHVNVKREVCARAVPSVQRIKDMGEAQIIRWPSLSDDGETMVFAAIGYIWIMDLETGEMRRLTDGADFEYMPALSPNGQSVAYISFAELEDEYSPARLVVASVDDASSQDLLTASDGMYLLPRWSEDGEKIALMRETKTDDGLAFGWTSVVKGDFVEVARAPASDEFSSLFIYARTVGFDEGARNLLFSYPTSRTQMIFAMAGLNGEGRRTLAVGAQDVGGIAPAPGLKSLALTARDGAVWVVPFEVDAGPVEVSTLSPNSRRVSESAGYYVKWRGRDEITFGFAQNVYRYGLNSGALDALSVKVTFAKPEAVQPIAFKGARLVTMSDDSGSGRVIDAGTIVIDGQRITGIGPMTEVVIPSGALVIDATGKTIIPGLLDTHYHRIGGDSLSAFALPNPDFGDPTAIAYGVTSAWEPGGPANDGVPATADLQLAGRIPGPRWSHSTMAMGVVPWEKVKTYSDVFETVARYKSLGVDVLKEVNTPTRKKRQWLSAAAREQGMGVVSHIDHFDAMMTRIVDGFTGGDHPYIPAPFYKDVQELLKQTGYIWTPNVGTTPGVVGKGGDQSSYYWRAVLDKRQNELEKLKTIASTSREATEPSVAFEIHRTGRVAKAAADAAANGVHIGVSGHSLPGTNLHREMWYLWKGGMPIKDVLRAATLGNAEKLGLQEEVGSLEVGKMADFLILEENPLDDIINTLSIEYTVQGGVIYNADTAERVGPSTLPACETESVKREACLATVN